jgi:hypothetical protein
MKLFGAKKGDDKLSDAAADDAFNDSPVETVSLNDPAPAGQQGRRAQAHDDEPRPHYGIDSAVQLMRALPVDQNVELVVQVIKTTLESLKVRVSDIIEDATKRQRDLEGRSEQLRKEIADFEREIAQRKETIARLESDHAETTVVKQRLELAEKSQKSQRPPTPTPPVPNPPQATVAK